MQTPTGIGLASIRGPLSGVGVPALDAGSAGRPTGSPVRTTAGVERIAKRRLVASERTGCVGRAHQASSHERVELLPAQSEQVAVHVLVVLPEGHGTALQVIRRFRHSPHGPRVPEGPD